MNFCKSTTYLLAILCVCFLVCKMALVTLFSTVSLGCEDRKLFICIGIYCGMPNTAEEMTEEGNNIGWGADMGTHLYSAHQLIEHPTCYISESLRFSLHAQIIQENPVVVQSRGLAPPSDTKRKVKARCSAGLSYHLS